VQSEVGDDTVAILLVFVLTAMPWQSLYAARRPRVVLMPDNVRAYLVKEDENYLFVYVPARHDTLPLRKGRRELLRYQNQSGYVFEEDEFFERLSC